MIKKNTLFTAFSVLLAFSCVGCSTPVYKQVIREQFSDNAKQFTASPERIYSACIKVFLLKSFVIEKENKEDGFILAKRSFQHGKRTTVLLLQGKIIASSDTASMVYLNAIETTEVSYVSDRTRFFLFLIPLPGGGGKQITTGKQEEKNIRDKEFYQHFFDLIEKELVSCPQKN